MFHNEIKPFPSVQHINHCLRYLKTKAKLYDNIHSKGISNTQKKLDLCETLNIKSSHKFNNLPLPPIKNNLDNNLHGNKHNVSSINSKVNMTIGDSMLIEVFQQKLNDIPI
jgi:hypothetical protein